MGSDCARAASDLLAAGVQSVLAEVPPAYVEAICPVPMWPQRTTMSVLYAFVAARRAFVKGPWAQLPSQSNLDRVGDLVVLLEIKRARCVDESSSWPSKGRGLQQQAQL